MAKLNGIAGTKVPGKPRKYSRRFVARMRDAIGPPHFNDTRSQLGASGRIPAGDDRRG
jgi:hypothetical protein